MKTPSIFLTLIALLAVTVIVFQSCKKEEEGEENQAPTCKISTPTNGQKITKGEIVTILVDAEDSDGTITEVLFYIDDIQKGSSTSFPYNYKWNTSNENEGNHTIKATVFDNSKNDTSNEISVDVIAGGSTPIANFIATPATGNAPLSVTFTDQSINSPTKWKWDFGDGGTSTQQNPLHVYNSAGTFTVTLTATNEYGNSSKTETDYIVVGTTPIADFTATPVTGDAPLSVTFTDQSINNPTRWKWDFGDGNISIQQNPSHIYDSPGTYTITLTAINQYGYDDETKTDYITVTDSNISTFTDPRDGQTYATIVIGSQIWFSENLKYLPSVSPSSEGSNDDLYYYVYDYQGTNVSEAKATDKFQTYGALYNWPSAVNACPAGWHLPSDDEWAILIDYLGGEYKAGGKMKEIGTTHWASPNTGASNESGFSALPGGYRNHDGTFKDLGDSGYWWSATESIANSAWDRYLFHYIAKAERDRSVMRIGFSVRCVQD